METLKYGVVLSFLILLVVPSHSAEDKIFTFGVDVDAQSSQAKPKPVPQPGSGVSADAGSGRQAQAANTTGQDLLSADWSVQAKPSVAERGFNKKAVAEFMDSLGGDPENPTKPEQIGDFQWVDVDKDGVYEFLVTHAASRAFFGGPAIYKVIGGKKVWHQSLGGWMLSDLDGATKDLDGDGFPELILPILLSDYRGARVMPVWTAVYKWNGEKYEEASAHFKEFYQKEVLPEVEARIREVTERARRAGKTPAEYDEIDEEILSAHQLIKDKIIRVTGEDPYAGVERARAWAKSPYPYVRENAIRVFEDIPGRYFQADLEVLAADPNPIVAMSAKMALERLGKKRP